MINKVEDVIIVGAGPAGIAAALQLKRSGFSPLLLEKNEIGGLLRNANLVENYPGFPEGISGVGLVELLRKQMDRLSVGQTEAQVENTAYVDSLFIVTTAHETYRSRRLIVSSGTKPNKLKGVEITSGALKKVFYEVYPLLEVKEKEIVIIGAGDAAFDYALNLCEHNQVAILNRTEMIVSLPLLVQRAHEEPHIRYFENTQVQKISEDGTGRLMVECIQNEGICGFSADYVIAAIGRIPDIDFLTEQILEQMDVLMSNGLLYLIGDVKNERYRQASIAVGDGIRAAMEIYQREERK